MADKTTVKRVHHASNANLQWYWSHNDDYDTAADQLSDLVKQLRLLTRRDGGYEPSVLAVSVSYSDDGLWVGMAVEAGG